MAGAAHNLDGQLQRRARSLAVLLGLVLTLCLAAVPGVASAGTVVADSGFRPDPDGFSFPNYGNDEGFANLDADEMQRMFGEVVCMSRDAGRCDLTPAARAWMKSQNTSMSGGHCFGFAVLSSILQKGQLPQFGYRSLSVFGRGPTAFDLGIEGNPRLQRSIARAWTYQTLPSINNAVSEATPSEVVAKLRRVLTPRKSESWTFMIFEPGYKEGHAITPYALEREGKGIYDVHAYDNNWPGDSTRRVRVDTKRNTWSYLAAVNPKEPSSWYRGDATTKTLLLAPSQPGEGTQAATDSPRSSTRLRSTAPATSTPACC